MTRRPRPIDVLCSVSRHTRTHPSLILDTTARSFSAHRWVYATVLRDALGMSHPEIAREIGYAGHSSVGNLFRNAVDRLHIAREIDPAEIYMVVMADVSRDELKTGTAELYAHGRVARLRSNMDGSVTVTCDAYPGELIRAGDAKEALALASAWLAQSDEVKAA